MIIHSLHNFLMQLEFSATVILSLSAFHDSTFAMRKDSRLGQGTFRGETVRGAAKNTLGIHCEALSRDTMQSFKRKVRTWSLEGSLVKCSQLLA